MRQSFITLVGILLLSPVLLRGQPTPSPARHSVMYAPPPSYPLEARRRRIEGTGLYKMHILPNGTVASVEIVKSSGSPILDQAAVSALRRWRFLPKNSSWALTTPLTFTMKGYLRQ